MGYEKKDRFFPVDIFFHDTILEDTDCLENVKSSRITGINSVEDKADYDFFPRGYITVPKG
jgi:hypothetical protein